MQGWHHGKGLIYLTTNISFANVTAKRVPSFRLHLLLGQFVHKLKEGQSPLFGIKILIRTKKKCTKTHVKRTCRAIAFCDVIVAVAIAVVVAKGPAIDSCWENSESFPREACVTD